MNMPAYVVIDLEIKDQSHFARYQEAAAPVVAQYGGKRLVNTSTPISLEGDWKPSRLIVFEFPDQKSVLDFYESAEYRALVNLRLAASHTKGIVIA